MEIQVNNNSPIRKFGHGFVTWDIANFCFSAVTDGWEIESPGFNITGFRMTKWRVVLKSRCSENSACDIFLRLERLEACPTSEVACVDCRFYVRTELSPTHRLLIDSFTTYMAKDSMIELDMKNVMGYLQTFQVRDLKIDCDLLVHFDDVLEEFEECTDIGIKALSEDLDEISRTSNYFDLLLVVAGKTIPAHKAILHTRNSCFSYALDEIWTKNPGQHILNINFVSDHSAVKKVVDFLYSGNMRYVVEFPSISVFEFASLIGVTPVIEYYMQDHLEIRSTIEMEDFRTTWAISDILTRTEQKFEIPFITAGIFDTTWCLHLNTKYLKGDTEYVTASIEYLKGKMRKEVCVEFGLMKDNTVSIHRKSFTTMEKIESVMCRFFRSNELMNYLENGDLNVTCRLRIFTGKIYSSLVASCSRLRTFSPGRNYLQLSEDMERLYKYPKFYDFHLFLSENKLMNVHRSILDARCSIISKTNVDENGYGCNRDYDQDAVEVFARFLYSGRIDSPMPILTQIFEVYENAHNFDVPSLKQILVKMLKDNMTIGTAHNTFVFADDMCDKDSIDLALFALRYMRNFTNSSLSIYR